MFTLRDCELHRSSIVTLPLASLIIMLNVYEVTSDAFESFKVSSPSVKEFDSINMRPHHSANRI